MSTSCKPSRAAPPPPVPSHAPHANHLSHFNGDRNNNRGTSAGKIPTVIRPKMVETPTKKAPPRPPPPRMDYVPTRTTSLPKGSTAPLPPIPAPPAHKGPSSKGNSHHPKGLHINTAKALKKVKIFGKSSSGGSSKSSTSNANGEFLTSGLGGDYGGYTNQALSQPPRTNGKKQAPPPPRIQTDFGGGTGSSLASAVAIGTLISFDSPPSSSDVFGPNVLPPAPTSKNRTNSNNVQSLLDVDFPEPGGVGGGTCLLDMDIPPMISSLSTSQSVDNFGSTPFDPFVPPSQQPQLSRKSSLPVTAEGLIQPLLPLGASTRISEIREEGNFMPPRSPPPPRGPAPQLNPHDTSTVHPKPCGMALRDNSRPAVGELTFNQYDLIELISDNDDRYYMGRIDDQEGLVSKDALEVFTPLEESQQECLQNDWKCSAIMNKRRNDDKHEQECFNPRNPTSQSFWSTKPVASVSPLPVFSNKTVASGDRNGGFLNVFPLTQPPVPPEGEWAVALYDFEAQRDDELGFVAGEKLHVESRYDTEWFYGRSVKDSRYGLFPAAFVQLTSENDSETESLKEADSASSKTSEFILPKAIEGLVGSKTGLSDGVKGRAAVALYAFVAEQEGDLGFEEGETVWVLSRINKDWLQGRNSRGDEGQFPASFVQPEAKSAGTTIQADNSDGNKEVDNSKETSGVFVCLYDFEAQQDDDLTIHEGDKIQVTKMVSEEWWQGRILGSQREGIFPATFVKPL
ncbi:hypothetical protein BIW11_02322 [Tropilaelaps mercedesae]|uniref:SH3 domain-containing protein n=1 Tax=Tropilaelaps mercedesae TaxID=418985 RepID=A0A1V9WZB8_9ACAR|nr:hypothetical protein BIW11_02322 [Tropilaelaps mercedesae]